MCRRASRATSECACAGPPAAGGGDPPRPALHIAAAAAAAAVLAVLSRPAGWKRRRRQDRLGWMEAGCCIRLDLSVFRGLVGSVLEAALQASWEPFSLSFSRLSVWETSLQLGWGWTRTTRFLRGRTDGCTRASRTSRAVRIHTPSGLPCLPCGRALSLSPGCPGQPRRLAAPGPSTGIEPGLGPLRAQVDQPLGHPSPSVTQ